MRCVVSEDTIDINFIEIAILFIFIIKLCVFYPDLNNSEECNIIIICEFMKFKISNDENSFSRTIISPVIGRLISDTDRQPKGIAKVQKYIFLMIYYYTYFIIEL